MKLETIALPVLITLLASMTLNAQSPKLNQISVSLGTDQGVCISAANSVSDAFSSPLTVGSASSGSKTMLAAPRLPVIKPLTSANDLARVVSQRQLSSVL
jgi:hypothetical protein